MTRFTTRRSVGHSLIAVVAVAVLSSCGGDEPELAAAPDACVADPALPAPGLVSPTAASDLACDERITVIDVRTPEEYDAGHLAETDMLIDFYSDTFADEIAALDRDGEYLIYCRSGNRSGQTAALMEQLGFEQVWDLDGGVNAWAADGLALVTP